ncbi:MAG: DNA-methyltransferase [Candidatus Odinarchaeia archaeon]
MDENILNKLYCEECISFMSKLDSESIDIIITSPPYNLNINYNTYKDNKPFENYLCWLDDVAQSCKRILKPKGSFFLNLGNRVSDSSKPFQIILKLLNHFELQNTIHWIKSIAVPEHDINLGHFKPVNSYRYMNNCHEYIFHLTKHNNIRIDKLAIGVPFKDKSNITRWTSNKRDCRDRGNVWYIPYKTVNNSKQHPASFPVNLPEMCIKLHGYQKDLIVFDPFIGIGTTALACQNLGCNYLGCDIDAKYIAIANKNLAPEKRNSL